MRTSAGTAPLVLFCPSVNTHNGNTSMVGNNRNEVMGHQVIRTISSSVTQFKHHSRRLSQRHLALYLGSAQRRLALLNWIGIALMEAASASRSLT